jgi:transcriptional regulator with XRE-family HTH domain
LKKLREEIGARLRAARKAARVSLKEAGDEIGRSKQAVHAYETGESDISATQLAVLCTRYGVTSEQVLFGLRGRDGADGIASVVTAILAKAAAMKVQPAD